MSDPVQFTSATPRFALPYLFAAQAQREFFVNEAFARIDALLHAAVIDERAAPPDAPAIGAAYLVGPAPGGAFADRTGALAIFGDGGWIFIPASEGMAVYDLSKGLVRRRQAGAWTSPAAPPAPAGGTVIDEQSRSAIAALVAVLKQAGVIS